MSANITIRQIVSFLLIGFFAFCITPKKVLHNWVANHTDQDKVLAFGSSASETGTPALSIAGFHCDTDNLVTESPFDLCIEPSISVRQTIYAFYANVSLGNFFTRNVFYYTLRGPPADIELPA